MSTSDVGPSEPNYSGSGFKTGLKGNDYAGTLAYFTPHRRLSPPPVVRHLHQPRLRKFGNLERNSFFGPNFYNVDLAAQKNFRIKESVSAIFRTDFFNVLNHQSYAITFDHIVIDSKRWRRTITGLAPGSNPRQLQFAVRLKF